MISLKSLSIENFRGIRQGRIDGMSAVNILVGRNNSGKTSLFEAFQRFAAPLGLAERDVAGRTLDGIWDVVRQLAGSPELMWYRQDTSNPITFSGVTETNGRGTDEITVEMAINPAQGRPPVPRVLKAFDRSDRNVLTGFYSSFTVLRPTDTCNQAVEHNLWRKLLANRRDKVLTSTFNEIFGLKAESFQQLPTNQLMVLFEDYSVPLDSQGDGARAALRILMVLSILKGTMLMLEEPECFQHPGSLERFSAALCKLAKNQEVQLVISTHSSECVGSFLRAAKAAESDAAVFHLTLDNGKQSARRLDPEAVETLTCTGVDVRFMDLYA